MKSIVQYIVRSFFSINSDQEISRLKNPVHESISIRRGKAFWLPQGRPYAAPSSTVRNLFHINTHEQSLD